jgi:hypothetical protein
VYATSRLTRGDWDAYLSYLGGRWEPDSLARCVHRAYIDFRRTLYGIGELGYGSTFQAGVEHWLCQTIRDAADQASLLAEPEEFDDWHGRQCQNLIDAYREAGYGEQGVRRLHVGQAQKWLNMTFKYVFALGPERVSNIGPLYPVAHVPFDNILLEHLARFGFAPFGCPWSRLDDYDVYLDRQRWLRGHFAPVPPLDVEFHLWLNGELPTPGLPGSDATGLAKPSDLERSSSGGIPS